ncbi:MAG: sodium:solute symporter family protein [Burkholderiaceae bacterium]|jgi:SSS family transporter|nr:sodium:solute symporter family protein [Burkholderiaceae bacterium]
MTLITFVVLYLLISIAIGLYAATRVKNTADYAVAGRSLPLVMIITTTFATWFGSETVLGIPAKFIEGGMTRTVEDPFGAGMALILVGAFFAARLYRMNLITIGDFYRQRYSKGVEMFSAIVIMISYLGWVAAQITALGLVFNLLSGGAISTTQGMIIGTAVVLTYTVFGGMWSVALTDFVQMLIIIAGLSLIAWFAADLAGGADKVVAYAASKDMFNFWPEMTLHAWLFWISAAITLMIGSIPQQDVFQRVMSAKDAKTAVRGPIIGGLSYIAFAFVPIFIGVAAFLVMPEVAEGLLKDDAQKILPTLVMERMPVWLQVLFFGALLSAIMSTASATLLAPSTTFVENILKNFVPLSDKRELRAMRITLFAFACAVLAYSIIMEGTPIYELVGMAYQFPVVGAFWPLVCGLYWKRSTTQGAVWSMALGMSTWALLSFTPLGEEVFPAVLGGFIMAGVGMVVGSLLPTQGNRDHHTRRRHPHHPHQATSG